MAITLHHTQCGRLMAKWPPFFTSPCVHAVFNVMSRLLSPRDGVCFSSYLKFGLGSCCAQPTEYGRSDHILVQAEVLREFVCSLDPLTPLYEHVHVNKREETKWRGV